MVTLTTVTTYDNMIMKHFEKEENVNKNKKHTRSTDDDGTSVVPKVATGGIYSKNTGDIEMPKMNIRDTKQYYSEVNNMALNGLEVITYKGVNKNVRTEDEVSHIKTIFVERLMDNLAMHPKVVEDERLHLYTVSVSEIGMYGEGDTIEAAIQDLVESVEDYIEIWREKIEFLSKVESVDKQVYMLKLMRCDGNKDLICKALGVTNNGYSLFNGSDSKTAQTF